MTTLRDIAGTSTLPRLEWQMLWQHVLQVGRAWLIAHDTDPLTDDALARYRALEARRLAGEPMAYILASREFMGHDFVVTPAVLIPRPETELLVETALDYLDGHAAPTVLDLGTGSGAIAICIALAGPSARVVATDVSAESLEIARRNAQRLGAPVEFLCGSWYDALSEAKGFDLIVSNPPYIAAADDHLQQGDLRFEPAHALTDGHDGLDAIRAIIDGAGRRLNPGGGLFVEHGWDQAAQVRDLMALAGFAQVESLRDLAGIERVTGGTYN